MTERMKLLAAGLALLFVSLACGLGGGESDADASESGDASPTTAAPTTAPTEAISAIPFEAVVQIIAAYYDEGGELQYGWTGSGTIVSKDGLILTNAHVVLSDEFYQVDELIVALTISQDQEPEPTYYAEVLQADEPLDIAVIRLTSTLDGSPMALDQLPVVPLGDSDDLSLGDAVTILGYPGIGGQNITLTSGQVSGFTAEPGRDDPRAFIKTDATIAGGNSGGLAADEEGYLIGIPTQLGYGGDDQFVDCRVLVDTNRDGNVNDLDNCVPTGGFINALRPIKLALPLIEAAGRGEVSIERFEQPVESVAVPISGETLFFDDFSDAGNSLVEEYVDEKWAQYNEEGVYYFEVYSNAFTAYDYYLEIYDNVVVEADVLFFHPATDGGTALLCRVQEGGDDFYSLEVTEDGYYAIYKRENSEWVALVEYTPSDYIAQNAAEVMHVTAVCDGSFLSLSVDGRLLAEVSDSSFSQGYVGISAAAFENPDLGVAFDNFQVSRPQSEIASDGEIVIADDFETPGTEYDTAEYANRYVGGEQLIEVRTDAYTAWNSYVGDIANSVSSVDVRFVEPAVDGEAALICRLTDNTEFYLFTISADGYYTIELYDGSNFVPLLEWQYSDYVLENVAGAFTMSILCDGDNLALAMNDEILGTVKDSSLTSGAAAVAAGTFTTPGVIVAFDNYEVRLLD